MRIGTYIGVAHHLEIATILDFGQRVFSEGEKYVHTLNAETRYFADIHYWLISMKIIGTPQVPVLNDIVYFPYAHCDDDAFATFCESVNWVRIA